ncbi:MAG TPA: ATP-binding protein [Bryobacteraceae bacterium]|nr:ATP-binding protein [Bryobacteraceae bacterium]
MGNPRPLPDAAPQLALPWIVRLRYGMALGQITTSAVVHFLLRIELPLAWIAIGPMLVLVSNFLLAARVSKSDLPRRMSTSALVTWVFVLDTVCLTYVLMLTGGPSNPFSLLYLVQITLSAAILTKRSTWALGALSAVCFGLLFWIYLPIPAMEMRNHGQGTGLHLVGMWVGFAVAASLVAMFSGEISELLRQREDSLLRMQEELARKDRLASLATLAAGAAHELNTPLGTIAVVAKELERYATLTARDPALAEDSRLIRTEVDRCREILWRMSVQGAEPAGQAAEPVEARSLVHGVIAEIPQKQRLQVDLAADLPELNIPRRAVEQALIALIKNAFEASGPDDEVRLAARHSGGSFQFVITDRGKGMSPETLRRIGEPFFTTKEPGKGMGLGTFLVRSLAEQLGGRLTFESSADSGASAIFELPAAARPIPSHVHE